MASLERRIRRLEDRSGPAACPTCGHTCGQRSVEYEVIWHDAIEDDDGPEENIYCEVCGQALEFVVVWEDQVLPGEGVSPIG